MSDEIKGDTGRIPPSFDMPVPTPAPAAPDYHPYAGDRAFMLLSPRMRMGGHATCPPAPHPSEAGVAFMSSNVREKKLMFDMGNIVTDTGPSTAGIPR